MSVSELLQRLQALPFGAPWDWRQIRKDIHDEHERATTTADRVALLAIYKSVMDAVERNADFAPEDMEKFKKARRQDYSPLLFREAASPDGNIDPQKIEEITRREVEAGRMAPDDNLRELAAAGATVLTSFRTPEERQRAKLTLLVRLGNVLYWLGCGLACAVLALGGLMAYADKQEVYSVLTAAMVAAVLVWLAGRACRYVLSGN